MNRVEKTHLPVAALTHPGMKGKNNEDRFGVSSFRSKALPNTPILLAVLSDGIGGNRAGEVASELAVNLISQYVAESDGRSPQAILEGAIHFASGRIFQQAQQNVEQSGMGATCACAWIAGDRLFIATVGDSRIYLMRGDRVQQLSTDHTWIQEALERGLIEPSEANGHPNAHVIRRYLGSPTPPEVDFRVRSEVLDGSVPTPSTAQDATISAVDVTAPTRVRRISKNPAPAPAPQEAPPSSPTAQQGFRLLPGDRLLLCSDGLTDLVSDEEILTTFKQSSLEEGGNILVNMANERGGHDNITIIAVQVPESAAVKPAALGTTALRPGAPRPAVVGPVAAAPPRATLRSRLSGLLAGCLIVIAIAALAGALAGGYLLYAADDNATPTPTHTPLGLSTATATRTPLPIRTMQITPSPVLTQPTLTPTNPRPAGPVQTVTPWPTNTSVLPIVPTRAP